MDARPERSLRHDQSTYQITASFSSALLDAIYRSIDDEEATRLPVLLAYKGKTPLEKHAPYPTKLHDEKQLLTPNLAIGYKRPEFLLKKKLCERPSYYEEPLCPLSSRSGSSSSESSSTGGFSSSETESARGATSTRPPMMRTASLPKPVLTRLATSRPSPPREISSRALLYKSSNEKLLKSKSRTTTQSLPRASDTMRPKKNKPVSPAARLAGFLCSLAKKAKLSSSSVDSEDPRSQRRPMCTPPSSTCSSASSYSRKSCLSTSCINNSKTTSSRGRSVDGVKRSVRFYPVSVDVDGDCRPCGQKCLWEEGLTAITTSSRSSDHFPPSEFIIHGSAGNEILSEYQKKVDFMLRDFRRNENDEDDDAASDSSSDLFELENLAGIGMDQYGREELPVFETTDLNTNRAIANGL